MTKGAGGRHPTNFAHPVRNERWQESRTWLDKAVSSFPLPPGTRVEVFIVAPGKEDFQDLVSAAASSMGFWDNPLDDEDWNNA